MSFYAEFDNFCNLAEAAIGFTAETIHFSETKLLLEKLRFSFVVFDMFDETLSRGDVVE